LWALLVAGSDGWWNYRHQADVCHAYQVLHAHGIPDENIIIMMKDDIANDPENPMRGKIINHPNGSDVYHGVPKDYVGEHVTPENFIHILTGNKTAMRGIGSGKVIDSGPGDHVFVNFVDHGAVGLLGFPTDELTVKQLKHALTKMQEEDRYEKLVLYIEACEAGSMFEGVLPKNVSIFATTAANADENSWACYCDNDLVTCLGDHYSVSWMEDSDKEDLEKETLQTQFKIVKKLVDDSHVTEYGDLSIGKLVVGEFQGEEESNVTVKYPEVRNDLRIPSRDVPLHMMYKKLKSAKNSPQETERLRSEIERMLEKRDHVQTIVKKLLAHVAMSAEHHDRLFTAKPSKITDLDCHHDLVKAFSRYCFNFGKNPYALNYAHVLANMCEHGVDPLEAIRAMERVCKTITVKERIE